MIRSENVGISREMWVRMGEGEKGRFGEEGWWGEG